jgi:hypothetical protein
MLNNQSEESSQSNKNSEQDDDNDSEGCDSVGFNINKNSRNSKEKKDIKFLGSKTQRNNNNNETNMIYSEKDKKFVDSFIPDIEGLNKFLQNCTIIEINKEDIKEEIKNIPKEKIFDPDEFIRNNYQLKEKNSISIEDLFLELDKNNNEKSQNLEALNEPISKVRNFNEILQEKNLDKQKKEINDIINNIKQMKIEEIKENELNKLNIVFDLDNTCVYSTFIHPNLIIELIEKFPQNDFKIIKFEYNQNYIYYAFIIRKGLEEFLNCTKKFCNFYINTLGMEQYGKKIKDKLEAIFKITFKGFKGRVNNSERNKFLYDLSLEQKNTIIFDDKPIVWTKDKGNIIISKFFVDKKITLNNLRNVNLENNESLLFGDYSPFPFYKSSENNWQIQSLRLEKKCPFYDLKNKKCYSGEYVESDKDEQQFLYMIEIVKLIYYLLYKYNIYVPESLKIIRYNIFYNCSFNLNFYKKTPQKKQNERDINILKHIIINCGGIICDENNFKGYTNYKYYFVCTKDDYKKNKDEINKQKIGKKSCKVISDEFIINSFFFMTYLGNENNNSKYCLDLNDEDDFDNY